MRGYRRRFNAGRVPLPSIPLIVGIPFAFCCVGFIVTMSFIYVQNHDNEQLGWTKNQNEITVCAIKCVFLIR
jgi:hypothetical protein